MSKVRFESSGKINRITLDDPPLNILDIAMLADLRDALGRVDGAGTILVITAEGEKAFSAGASVQDHMGDRIATMLGTFHDCFRMLHRIEMPVVALVNGLALGGGCELALACDFVLASDSSRFGQPEINLGVFPPVAAYQLSRQVPVRRGLELMLGGRPVDAATALQLGMVNAVFPAASFVADADKWLESLLAQSPSSLRFAKRAFRMAAPDDFEEKLARVERLYLDELMKTADANEGLEAFVAKRKAVWRGK